MSRFLTIALAAAVTLAAGAGVAGEMAWFDMQNCAMCKNISSDPTLMENITWEQHNIENGIVAVTTVSAEYVDNYRMAHAKMAEAGMKMHSGAKMELCGSCTALGMCMMKGVDQQYVETSVGSVWIVTSENEEVVMDLQNWAKRNTEEMAKAKS